MDINDFLKWVQRNMSPPAVDFDQSNDELTVTISISELDGDINIDVGDTMLQVKQPSIQPSIVHTIEYPVEANSNKMEYEENNGVVTIRMPISD